jgi:hypothetical protein
VVSEAFMDVPAPVVERLTGTRYAGRPQRSRALAQPSGPPAEAAVAGTRATGHGPGTERGVGPTASHIERPGLRPMATERHITRPAVPTRPHSHGRGRRPFHEGRGGRGRVLDRPGASTRRRLLRRKVSNGWTCRQCDRQSDDHG